MLRSNLHICKYEYIPIQARKVHLGVSNLLHERRKLTLNEATQTAVKQRLALFPFCL